MKRKMYIAITICMCAFALNGCGKQKQSLSDNIANLSDEVQGMDEIDSQIQEMQANNVNYLTSEEDANNDNFMDSSVSYDAASMNNISENGISENEVSGNAISEDMLNNDPNSLPMNDANNEKTVNMDEYFANMAINNTLNIADLSGKDLKEVYVTFNVGNINNVEITNGKKLKDGEKIKYTIADMESFKNADSIIMTLNGVDKKGDTISYGTVRIVDASNMNVVLTKSEDIYKMYIR